MHPEIRLAIENINRDIAADNEKLEAELRAYIKDYTLRGDGADHTPTANERLLIEDAIRGLLAEKRLVRLISKQVQRRGMLESLSR